MKEGVPYDVNEIRPALERLEWGTGLNRDEMLNQSSELRQHHQVMMLLPKRYSFKDAGSVMSYFDHLERTGVIKLIPLEPPMGYPEQSPTGRIFTAHPVEPSVGSGVTSGNTGASYQTGVGREGVWDHKPGKS